MNYQEPQTEETPAASLPDHTVQAESIETVIKRLGSENIEAREQAEQAFRALIERDVQIIRRNWAFRISVAAVCGIIVLPLLVYNLLQDGPDKSPYCSLITWAMLGLQYVLAIHLRSVSRRLDKLDAPQAVGPLVDILAKSGFFRQDTRRVLARLLPRLKASDAKWLNARQRKHLLGFLKSDEFWPYNGRLWGADLKIAILKALEQIGGAKAIPVVERVARKSKNERVRLAAQECLPFLREHVEQAQAGQNLLRASRPPVSADMLLRPAVADTAEAQPQQLLRPMADGTEAGA